MLRRPHVCIQDSIVVHALWPFISRQDATEHCPRAIQNFAKAKKSLFEELDVRAMYLLLGTDEKLTGLALPNLVGTRSLAEQCRNEGYFLLWCTRWGTSGIVRESLCDELDDHRIHRHSWLPNATTSLMSRTSPSPFHPIRRSYGSSQDCFAMWRRVMGFLWNNFL